MEINALWQRISSILFYIYEDPKDATIQTLSMMVLGLLLAGSVQLPLIASWVPADIQLTSIVRRFERFLSDPSVDVREYFLPFVVAMHISLGCQIAYLVIDCTKSGPSCRTVFIGLWYHNTVLPVVWETLRGSKGHVTGKLQTKLMEEVYPQFKDHHQVVVLGDAEFSNQTLIDWLLEVKWGFVFRFQSTYYVQLEDGTWISARDLAEKLDLKVGDLHYINVTSYTKKHEITGLSIVLYWEIGNEDPIFLVTNLSEGMAPHLAYKKRFAIETIFSQFKSRAFNLASTHIDKPEHIDRLILAIAIGTCLVLGLGTNVLLTNQQKMVDRTDRRDLSLFQIGYRYLIRLLVSGRVKNFKMKFSWEFKLPPAGYKKKKKRHKTT